MGRPTTSWSYSIHICPSAATTFLRRARNTLELPPLRALRPWPFLAIASERRPYPMHRHYISDSCRESRPNPSYGGTERLCSTPHTSAMWHIALVWPSGELIGGTKISLPTTYQCHAAQSLILPICLCCISGRLSSAALACFGFLVSKREGLHLRLSPSFTRAERDRRDRSSSILL